MRQEDKEIDGFELQRAREQQQQSEKTSQAGDELEELENERALEAELARDPGQSSIVASAMRTILAREHIVINNLPLPQRELRALEALKTAVDGRDQEIHGFVFADDRRTLLEQALAILQPDLVALEQHDSELFHDFVQDVASLRERLGELQLAQFQPVRNRRPAPKAKPSESDDKDDKDDKADKDDDMSLTGPEREIEKPPSSLTGPEREAPPKPPTTLGDPAEIAAAARPWWKRA